MPLRFASNLSDATEIARHLRACSSSFVPPLHTRVAIPDYAAKLAARAERFEAWDGPRLIGLVAIYCGVESRQAFVSNVSVEPSFTRQGIATRLLTRAIDHARRHAETVILEVDRQAPALALYRSFGFQAEDDKDNTLQLFEKTLDRSLYADIASGAKQSGEPPHSPGGRCPHLLRPARNDEGRDLAISETTLVLRLQCSSDHAQADRPASRL